jgi:hypothetical protein
LCQFSAQDDGADREICGENELGAALALNRLMSSLDNIYKKMDPDLETQMLARLHRVPPDLEPDRRVGREVAHELSNILTIVLGYTDKMLLCHRDNPALRPDLLVISENVRRAVTVVRQATPKRLPTL